MEEYMVSTTRVFSGKDTLYLFYVIDLYKQNKNIYENNFCKETIHRTDNKIATRHTRKIVWIIKEYTDLHIIPRTTL
jgi:hypothetical protein